MDVKLIIELAKVLGIPGLIIACWYLIERAKGKRAEKADEAKLKIDLKKLELEERRVDALTSGFAMMGSKFDEHTTKDLEHHAKVSEQVARLDGKLDGILDQADRFTPVGVEPPQPQRPRTNPGGVAIAAAGGYGPRRGGRDG